MNVPAVSVPLQHPLFDLPVTPSTTDEWYTPPWVFNACGVIFDLDVCAPVDPQLRTVPARRYLTADDDGLLQPWHGTVWCNPPYSRADPWVTRFVRHGHGMVLVPALPEVRWRGTLTAAADALALLDVEFLRPNGTTARLRWPLILAAIGPDAERNVARVSAADAYSRGAYHLRPGCRHYRTRPDLTGNGDSHRRCVDCGGWV